MAILNIDTCDKYKDLIHPNIVSSIENYRDGNQIVLPPFHGCHHINKNGTRKFIDYSRGQQC